MTASKGGKQGKSGAAKKGAAKSKKAATKSQSKGKKAGTRVGTLGDVRSADSKANAGSRSGNKLRDGKR